MPSQQHRLLQQCDRLSLRLRSVPAHLVLKLNFNCFPSFYIVAPQVNISMETVGVQGNSLTLDCNPIGQPAPSVTWFRGPTQVQADGSRVILNQLGQLVVTPVFSLDAGTYRCVASNRVGTASAQTDLTVLGKPRPPINSSGLPIQNDSSYKMYSLFRAHQFRIGILVA